ncbi:MAG: cadmium-containing carbonic anhydrase [Actinomycetaceae bacterium]|nr:cadmium-containing carbonic anhydrase [Actinomycetaceae bacterium]
MMTLSSQAVGSIRSTTPLPTGFVAGVKGGDFSTPVPQIPRLRCMDGRPDDTGWPSGVCIAGGPMSVLVASLHLLHEQNAPCDLPSVLSRVPHKVKEAGLTPVIHTASSEHGSGCGALDGMRPILDVAHLASSAIEELAAGDSLPTLPDGFEFTGFALPGRQLAASFRDAGAHLEHLLGSHHEQMIIINLVAHTQVSRQQIAEAFDGQTQAFVLDLWAAPIVASLAINVARAFLPDFDWEPQREKAEAAVITYSLAAALTLCAPGMPVVTIAT